jgi:hypothetical protein
VDWLSGETLKALTTDSVLLALLLFIGFNWVRDRNARLADKDAVIADKNQEIQDWKSALHESEIARETQTEALREALEIARTSEAVITGLRSALDQRTVD